MKEQEQMLQRDLSRIHTNYRTGKIKFEDPSHIIHDQIAMNLKQKLLTHMHVYCSTPKLMTLFESDNNCTVDPFF